MNIDKAVFRFAGCVILASIALAHWVHPYWIGLTIFAGVNMIQASFTGFCPVAYLFRGIGLPEGAAFKSCQPKSK